MGFEFKFPRHLFTPFLVYDGVRYATQPKSPPPSPPSEPRTVTIRIDPVVDYVSRLLQDSKSSIQQSVTQLSIFTLDVAGKGELVINGNFNLNINLEASTTARSYINDTIINRLTLEIPPLFANVQVSGPTDPEVRARIDLSVRQTLSQENYAKIVQSTFDSNRGKIIVRGYMEIDEAVIEQGIVTHVLATNIIQAIIDNSTDISISSGDEEPPPADDISGLFAILAGVLSSISSLILCIILLVVLFSGKKS